MPSNVLVSGLDPYAGYDPNGEYSYTEILNGKPRYVKSVDLQQHIEWSEDRWNIYSTGDTLFVTYEDVAYPWLVTNWEESNMTGSPVVTEAPVSVDPITLRNAKYATITEAGSARFRRLVALGYV